MTRDLNLSLWCALKAMKLLQALTLTLQIYCITQAHHKSMTYTLKSGKLYVQNFCLDKTLYCNIQFTVPDNLLIRYFSGSEHVYVFPSQSELYLHTSPQNVWLLPFPFCIFRINNTYDRNSLFLYSLFLFHEDLAYIHGIIVVRIWRIFIFLEGKGAGKSKLYLCLCWILSI